MAMIFGLTLNHYDRSYSHWQFFFCLVLLGLIEISDLLDGYSARKLGLVSEHGAMLDPYADSVSRLIVFWSLASVDYISFLVPLVMALRDVTVAYSRIILTRHNRSVAAKRSGKIKAVVQGVGAFIILLLGPVYGILIGIWPKYLLSWIIIIATAASVFEYAASAVSVALEESRKTK